MAKSVNAASALVAVIDALETLDDKDRQWVLQSAASRWSIVVPTSNAVSGGGGTVVGQGLIASGANAAIQQNSDVQAAISRNDARGFMRSKRPATDVQRVACLGYYHLKTTGQHGFTSKDILKLNTDSGGSKFNLTRALDNATRRSKYLASRGGNNKQLTTLGEDIVEVLPSQEAVAAAEEAARKSTKGKKKAKKKAKKA
jgi:hypothetical protein